VELDEPVTQRRLLDVYLDGIEEWGRATEQTWGLPHEYDDDLVPEARDLVRSLQRDGLPVTEAGALAVGAARLEVARFERLGEPRVLLEHLARIDAGIATDPAAAIASAKELVESACKFVLDDYSVRYDRGSSLPDLYKAVAKELRLSRESVPDSARGSHAAHRVLQNLMTAVQGLAELRNELGLGHGRTTASPALARHARLAANSARAVVEFVLDTWHARREAEHDAGSSP
jgi:hypothetical protein